MIPWKYFKSVRQWRRIQAITIDVTRMPLVCRLPNTPSSLKRRALGLSPYLLGLCFAKGNVLAFEYVMCDILYIRTVSFLYTVIFLHKYISLLNSSIFLRTIVPKKIESIIVHIKYGAC